MSHVDGNALAGVMADALGADVTTMRVGCAHCGTVSIIAETMVTFDGPGPVAHCPTCAAILLRVVSADDGVTVDVRGIRTLTIPRPDERVE
jgi:hypothetical protein